MNKINIAKKSINILSQLYPNVTIQLNFSTPFELLVATILSAQCTDARVNIVTQSLFRKYKTVNEYANCILEELEQDIYSTGFYKAKANNIRQTSNIVLTKFNGNVPETMEELLTLPGVGRKTANVVLGHCFNTPGIVVDTHVKRISNRLGLVHDTDPVKIEFALMEIIPKTNWIQYNHLLINFGRAICTSHRPKCLECPLSSLCEFRNQQSNN